MAQLTSLNPARPVWTFTDRLVKARKYAELNGEQLADRLGVSLKTLQRYELGLVTPKRGVILGWAMACGVDADWLEHGDGGPDDGLRTAAVTSEYRSGINSGNVRNLHPVAA